MENDYSINALLAFVDFLSQKGMMKKSTASARKASSNKFFSALDENELNDLRKVDIEDVATRFNNKFGAHYDTKSLRVYKSRAESTLSDFLSWKSDPSSFKVGTKSRDTYSQDSTRATKPSDNAPTSSLRPVQNTPVAVSGQSIPIPIRQDCVVIVENLPFDLTMKEAEKISKVILAYGSE